ncbi:MAG: cation:proton antiporter [Candidatus Harrisonbacteria bacterium CG10_big_fil_rev_8_21_14_0_10_42_17]|uniref:Cation:proton antiporter n=1 Tax=Candidatus Harrisonbacteria bacterium CG10_big_fil_rev_8_21_14_0_10_42_17 TaxID=1974584 RepID=A0A2M6WIT0_9BACT|nr:MAG: cation:proton antiporter [Candidatus Harrisonbacteria bacterium CG10_big_fil_rev_8_21_14_0_10_42_17]
MIINTLRSIRRYLTRISPTAIALVALLGFTLARASEEGAESAVHHGVGQTLLWIAVILIAAKLASLIEKWGQPAVLGELLIGVVLGNLALVGLGVFEPIKADNLIAFLAELGVIVLLFQIGLESNIKEMKKVGKPALMVAIVGVIIPFLLGTYVIGPWLLPGLESIVYLFLGATLTATSVGITARVFKDLGKLKTKEAQIVLGAAVIDDVLGLIILAVVSAIAGQSSVSSGEIGVIFAKALIFLIATIVVGQLTAPRLGKWFSKIHTGIGMKFTLAISFGLIFAYLAELIDLAPIVGAFAAGLVLDPVHFNEFSNSEVIDDMKKCIGNREIEKEAKEELNSIINHHAHRHIEEIIEPLGLFLVPIFFVLTGINVNLSTLFDIKVLLVALGITAVAFIGKMIAGLAAGNGVNKWIVGFGMAPRGEVGLIFATTGVMLGVVTEEVFSIIVIMVILTTLLTPPILTHFLKKQKA